MPMIEWRLFPKQSSLMNSVESVPYKNQLYKFKITINFSFRLIFLSLGDTDEISVAIIKIYVVDSAIDSHANRFCTLYSV